MLSICSRNISLALNTNIIKSSLQKQLGRQAEGQKTRNLELDDLKIFNGGFLAPNPRNTVKKKVIVFILLNI